MSNDATPAMRVLMVSSSFHPVNAGAEAFCLELSRSLERRGVKVLVLTARWHRSWPARERVEGVAVERYGLGFEMMDRPGLRKLGRYAYMAPLWRALGRLLPRFDLLHVHDPERHAALAAARARRFGLPVVVKDGNPISSLCRIQAGELGSVDRRLAPWLIGADAITVPAAALVPQIEGLGIARERIHLIPNGVPPAARVRGTGSPSGAPPRYVVAARLEPQKRLDIVIDAVAELRDAGVEVAVDCYGRGSLATELEARIRRLELADRVRLLGQVPEVKTRFADYDGMILASDAEGLSNALLEGLASGLPVIATSIPENRLVLEPGAADDPPGRGECRVLEGGLVFAPGDAGGLAAALERLGTDAELRRRLTRVGPALVAERYSLDAAVDRHLELYRSLFAGARRSG